ncbi:hypothetical protein PFISCL1PPCAC_5831, partial [Pristionchus fissidentatus]
QMLADALLVVAIAFCTALLGEGLTWVMVYRHDEYKRLKSEMEKRQKKLDKKKETVVGDDSKTGKRKIEREEEKLKTTNRDFSMFKMKSMFAIGLVFTALLSTFSSIFEGKVVAKLPFVPFSMIQGFSHRSLTGDDYTDCSFIFLYILCTMTIRTNLQKLLGVAPSRAMAKQQGGGFFTPPAAASNSQFSYLK